MGATLLKEIQYGTFCGEAKEGETPIIRNPLVAKGELRQVMHSNCETMWEAFELNLKKGRQNEPFLGYRKKIGKDLLENKFTWITYEEVYNFAINFSKGLSVMNLCPVMENENEDPFRFLGIYSKNKVEWLIAYLGAMRDSITIVTIYDTLGDFAVEFILEQTRLITIVVEVKSIKKILELAQKNKTSNLKNLIVIEKEEDEETCKNLEILGFNVYSFEQIIQKGKDEGQNIILTKPTPDSISTINYTSGTTGKPKGAKICHRSIILNTDVLEMMGVYPNSRDSYLSFLPYAHIMETLIFGVVLSRGVRMGIYNGNAHKIIEDLQILRPTAICAVPKIFQRIYDGIMEKLKTKTYLQRQLFNRAVEMKIKDFKETGMLKNILLDNLVFKEVRNSLGGRLRFMLVGSAPVEGYLLNFLRCTLSCEIVEGYGQTEDVAGVLLTKAYDPITKHIGGPGYSAELKLVDVPELGYSCKDIDKESGKSRPRGELCVRGPILFKGYFRDIEKTKEAIDEEGWLHSGDIAMIIPEHGNAMRLIDRVKNIFKLQQGEYIAPEKIENILLGSKYVEQIFIYGDTLSSYLICIIVPKENEVIEFFTNKGIKNVNKSNYKNYFDNEELKSEIIKNIDTYGRANDLKGFELPKKVYLSKEPFSVENQILTPTMKIRRHNAKNIFAEEIKNLYL